MSGRVYGILIDSQDIHEYGGILMERSLQMYNHGRKMEEWAQRVRDCRESGLSVRQWCSENGLSTKTYYYWQRKLFQLTVQPEPQFAEIEPHARASGAIAAAVHAGSVRVDVYNGADAETLAALVRAIRSC